MPYKLSNISSSKAPTLLLLLLMYLLEPFADASTEPKDDVIVLQIARSLPQLKSKQSSNTFLTSTHEDLRPGCVR